MEHRTRIGKFVDMSLAVAIAFIALTVLFGARFRNVMQGALLALPVTAMLCLAWALWSRRNSQRRLALINGRWQLHNLMVSPPHIALKTAAKRVAEHHGVSSLREQGDYCVGRMDELQIAIALLQLPADAKVSSTEILRIYHASAAERIIVLSTAPFSTDAAIFAKQLRGPEIALLGPAELEPLLRSLPHDEEAYARDKKKRRMATFSELRKRAADPERIRRYLCYGALMLFAYLALGLWPFLIPGLACIFLAVVARRQHVRKKSLFGNGE